MKTTDMPSSPRGMFTSCPECLKQFRIQAAQLSVASGQVECGACGFQFNALLRLSDVPLTVDELKDEFGYEVEPVEEPEFDIPDIGKEEKSVSGTQRQDEPENHIAQTAKSLPNEEVLLSEYQDNFQEDFPDELRETAPARRSLVATISWTLGACLLVTIFVAQLAWFNRDRLLLRYPQLEPVARDLCERLQCEILRYKDIGSIKLLNRDVRNHPLYEGSLLVNATMSNQSETIQPFPLIQLALFNTGGTVIGFREFKPEEYLDASIDIQAGMLPQSPVYFVLEVNGPTEDAVSFEFHFL